MTQTAFVVKATADGAVSAKSLDALNERLDDGWIVVLSQVLSVSGGGGVRMAGDILLILQHN